MSAARRLRKMKPHRLLARDWRLDFFHAIDLLQFALRLRSLARLGAKPVHERLQRRDLALLILVSGKLLHFARGLLLDVAVPIPAVALQTTLRDFHDRTDELIEKLAIV